MEKDLQNQEALSKFKELAEDIKICMFITKAPGNDHTRPMATIEVSDDGRLWFFTDVRSIKVEEVSEDKSVHLVYAHPGKEEYLDVWGSAKIHTEQSKIKDKWSSLVKAYFPQGPEDPNIALLEVTPADVYYWDAKSGKMVVFLKMAAAAITGKKLEQGEKGSLNLN